MGASERRKQIFAILHQILLMKILVSGIYFIFYVDIFCIIVYNDTKLQNKGKNEVEKLWKTEEST